MIAKDSLYAVVGASNNPEKYGYKVFKDLKEAGYTVYPVNLKENEILGAHVFHSLKEITKNIDVVITIVPPQVTNTVVREVKELGIKTVWMQPGSENQEAIEYCKENGIECVHGACIMIQRRLKQ